MDLNLAYNERAAFANRLRQALHLAGYNDVRASEVARQYMPRSARSLSPQSVRKWLNAEALPRQHHITSLATWLNCEPGWLRYGGAWVKATNDGEANREKVFLAKALAKLNPHQKRMVRELVLVMLSKMR